MLRFAMRLELANRAISGSSVPVVQQRGWIVLGYGLFIPRPKKEHNVGGSDLGGFGD